MTSLSLEQSTIVRAQIGIPIQVLASAGAGKTRVLTERIIYIVENTKKQGIIALTFTNKAAEEMCERLSDLDSINNRCWIGTIHSIAQRILEQYGRTIGLPSELHIYERDQDRKAIFLQSLSNNGFDVDAFLNISNEKQKKQREKIIQEYISGFSIVKRELLTEEEINKRFGEDFLHIFQAYQDALIESGGIDFDDILVYAHKILLEQPQCGDIYRAKYKHICVDEAQDLNKAQYEFIKVLCADKIKSVMMVGDPNQMIYGFNGSSHDFLCKRFEEDFHPTKYELKENYRSSKAVIHLANKIKPDSQTESEFALKGKSDIIELHDEQEEAQWILDKINELIAIRNDSEIEGEISLNKMVVIARNRFVFQALENLLKEKSISYSLKKVERQAEPTSTFGKILDLSIRLRVNPKDWIDGKKLCTVLKIDAPNKWGGKNLLEIFADKAVHSGIPFRDIQLKLLRDVQKLDLDQPNIMKFCSNFDTSIKSLVSDVLSENDYDELERSLQELNEFKNCWLSFRRNGLGESLLSLRNAIALGQVNNNNNVINELTLSTVHTMKGLEKDIVFLMGMCEGVFPDYRAHSNKELEEEQNNAYVAVTRSKRWIYITYPQQRKMPWGDIKKQNPSRFINDMRI